MVRARWCSRAEQGSLRRGETMESPKPVATGATGSGSWPRGRDVNLNDRRSRCLSDGVERNTQLTGLSGVEPFQKVLQFHSLVRLAATLPLLSSGLLPVPLPTAFAGVLGAMFSPLAAASSLSSFHFEYIPQQCPHPLYSPPSG